MSLNDRMTLLLSILDTGPGVGQEEEIYAAILGVEIDEVRSSLQELKYHGIVMDVMDYEGW